MTGYTRQSTFGDIDVIEAVDHNNEYNALETAFGNMSHSHDGSANSGPIIGIIGDSGEVSPNNKVVIDTANNRISFFIEDTASPVEQIRLEDGVLVPVLDSDIVLGSDSLRFSNGYFDDLDISGSVNIDGYY